MAVTVGREVLLIGAESAGRTTAHDDAEAYTAHYDVDAYNVDAINRRTLKPLQQGRHSRGAARVGDSLHVVAGAITTGGGNETSSHERLKID